MLHRTLQKFGPRTTTRIALDNLRSLERPPLFYVTQFSTSTSDSNQSKDDSAKDKFVRGPASLASSHWLDKYFPGTREWLEVQNRRWWISGVRSRCKQYMELKAREGVVTEYIEKAYRQYLHHHEDKIKDGRSQTHVQTACLVLATYKVLRSYIKNDEELIKIVKERMGGVSAPVIRGVLHTSLFIRRTMFRMHPFSMLSRMMKTLQLDMGASFECQFDQQIDHVTLSISSCLYHEIFLEEGVPQLTSCCCCSQDALWFDHLDFHKVGYMRTSWLADGDSKCTLELRKVP